MFSQTHRGYVPRGNSSFATPNRTQSDTLCCCRMCSSPFTGNTQKYKASTVTGHYPKEKKNIKMDQWLRQVFEHKCSCRRHATERHLPLLLGRQHLACIYPLGTQTIHISVFEDKTSHTSLLFAPIEKLRCTASSFSQ